MRRIIKLTGTPILGLAALMSITAPVSRQRGGGGRGGGGRVEGHVEARHVEARHVEALAIARTGSIHFGERRP